MSLQGPGPGGFAEAVVALHALTHAVVVGRAGDSLDVLPYIGCWLSFSLSDRPAVTRLLGCLLILLGVVANDTLQDGQRIVGVGRRHQCSLHCIMQNPPSG